MLLKWPLLVAERFTRLTHRVTVFSRTAILAPGGWASDREPAKRVCGRSLWYGDRLRKPLPSRNETSSFFACSTSGYCFCNVLARMTTKRGHLAQAAKS